MENIRYGIVGLGNMGRAHRQSIVDEKIKGLTLTAVCDIPDGLPEKRDGETQFTDVNEMIQSGKIDAIGMPWQCCLIQTKISKTKRV